MMTRKELTDLKTAVRDLGNNRIAYAAGVSKNFISMLINGKANASLETLLKIKEVIADLRKPLDFSEAEAGIEQAA